VVLDALKAIAPVHAVRGNNGKCFWASKLPTEDIVKVGKAHPLRHSRPRRTESRAVRRGLRGILSGHSHRPLVEHRKGVCGEIQLKRRRGSERGRCSVFASGMSQGLRSDRQACHRAALE
jgi:predicted phosphodiesterase